MKTIPARYAAAGIYSDLQNGRTVLVVGKAAENRVVFDHLVGLIPDDPTPSAKIRRGHGREQIQIGTGRVSFAASLAGVRGHSADVVICLHPPTEITHQELAPVLITGDPGEILYAI